MLSNVVAKGEDLPQSQLIIESSNLEILRSNVSVHPRSLCPERYAIG